MKTSKLLRLYSVCVIIALVSGNVIFWGMSAARYYSDLYRNRKSYDEAAEIYSDIFMENSLSYGTNRLEDKGISETACETAESENLPKNKILIDEMKEHFRNNDIFAYIKIEGTSVDYPIVHYCDNSFYIGNDIYRRPSACGAVFMDYENSECMADNLNTVIYGHNMKDGSMFHDLQYYVDRNYYNQNRYINFKTKDGNDLWEIFSFYTTDTSFDYIKTKFENAGDFYRFICGMKQKSLYGTGVWVDSGDRILTLSTCTNTAENTRYVVHAKLVR